jgi:predicted O-methyltransferase YrrM
VGEVRFLPGDHCEVGGMRFRYGAPGPRTTVQEAFICKDRAFLDAYARALPPLAPRRVLEFGILQGGSALFLTQLLDLRRLVCIDVAAPAAGFEAALDAHGLRGRIRPHWGVSQDDPARVRAIVAREFADGPPDLIIDDASHLLEPTRRAFEIAFPALRKGGHYIIEDWSWAHWAETQDGSAWSTTIAADAPALSNLIFDLVMFLPSTGLIERIEVRQGFVLIEKSHRDIETPAFSLDTLIRSRGRRLNRI